MLFTLILCMLILKVLIFTSSLTSSNEIEASVRKIKSFPLSLTSMNSSNISCDPMFEASNLTELLSVQGGRKIR